MLRMRNGTPFCLALGDRRFRPRYALRPLRVSVLRAYVDRGLAASCFALPWQPTRAAVDGENTHVSLGFDL